MSRNRHQLENNGSSSNNDGGRSKKRSRSKYTNDRDSEIARLEERIFGPESKDDIHEPGYVPPLGQKTPFKSLPLSEATLRALDEGTGVGRRSNKNKKKQRIRKRDYNNKNQNSDEKYGEGEPAEEDNTLNGVGRPKNFTIMTDIQNACIPHALRGRDILGAAKTGSGKTLAFLIPLVERLYRSKWSPADGVGAIILSPTRELAMQIFDVLRVVGRYHSFSAGLVVGGKADALEEEQVRLPSTNIIVATPGRLLQHLEETPMFDASTCQMLVLDEADRILDMGFRKQLYTILEYLPSSTSSSDLSTTRQLSGRQTLLFSATQTKDVKALAKLSLSKPEYIGVHDKESIATPEQLVQSLMVCPLEHKLDMVFSFLKSHLKHKILIFFSTCSQVRFIYELFCSLQPGISVLCLHGKIKQDKRTKIYFDFLNKPHAVLLATDVAARGLDFPNVDWVVQADSPEDRDAYIHRVGRTARNSQKGNSLLLVLPSEEEGTTNMLEQHSIPFKTLQMNPRKAVSITQRAAAIVASKPDLMIPLAKKAFSSYLRSLSLMPNKDIFGCDILKDLPVEEYATSLGLPSTPSTRFLKKLESRDQYREKKNKNYKLERLKEQIRNDKLKKRVQELSSNEASTKKSTFVDDDNSDDNHNDLLLVKQRHEWSDHDISNGTSGEVQDEGEKRKPKRIRVEGSTSGLNKKIVFDDNGNERPSLIESATSMTTSVQEKLRDASLEKASDAFMERIKDRLSLTREQDIAEEKARIREKRLKKKRQDKGADPSLDEDGFGEDGDESGGEKSVKENSNTRQEESSDESSDSSSGSSSTSEEGDNDDEDNRIDGGESLAEQEALALALLQGS